MENIETKKQELFVATLKAFIKYDNAVDTTKARNYWSEYRGFITAIAIMGWEAEFVEYSRKNNWDITLP